MLILMLMLMLMLVRLISISCHYVRTSRWSLEMPMFVHAGLLLTRIPR